MALPGEMTPDAYDKVLAASKEHGFDMPVYNQVMADGKVNGWKIAPVAPPSGPDPAKSGADADADAIPDKEPGWLGKLFSKRDAQHEQPPPAKAEAKPDDKVTVDQGYVDAAIAKALEPHKAKNKQLNDQLGQMNTANVSAAIAEQIAKQEGLTESGKFVLTHQNLGDGAVNKWTMADNGTIFCANPQGLSGVDTSAGMTHKDYFAAVQTKSAIPIHQQSGREKPKAVVQKPDGYNGNVRERFELELAKAGIPGGISATD